MDYAVNFPALCSFSDLNAVADRPAFRFRLGKRAEHRDLTFGQVHLEVVRRASALARAGCVAGERVALLMPHSERLVTTFFGSLYSGLVPSIVAWPTVKMDKEKYRRNVLAVVRSLRAHAIVTERSMAEELGAVVGEAKVIELEAVDRIEDQTGSRPANPTTTGPIFIQFSGGTTGTQKSVPITHGHLTNQLSTYASTLGLGHHDHVISWLPLYHDMGLVACLLLPFAYRLPVTIFSPIEWVMDPGPFLRAIKEDRATHCWLPNFAYAFMANRCRVPDHELDFTSLRAAINCSEPVRAESMDAFQRRFQSCGLRPQALHACYAMAESTFAATQTTDADPPRRVPIARDAFGQNRIVRSADSPRCLVSCGRPIPGMDVRIVDQESRECAAGQIGEIWLRGPSVMDDYLDTQGAPKRAFAGDWYRTGDLGALFEDHLFVTGRKKDVIIIGGVNVYPEDLEAAVSEVRGLHPGRAVALGLADQELGTERLVVVAEADSTDDLTRAEALEIEARKAVLAVCGVAPYRVFVVPPKWIVKSTAGKISRIETKARLLSRWSELTSEPAPVEAT